MNEWIKVTFVSRASADCLPASFTVLAAYRYLSRFGTIVDMDAAQKPTGEVDLFFLFHDSLAANRAVNSKQPVALGNRNANFSFPDT